MLLPLLLLGCPWIPCNEQLYVDVDGDGWGNPSAAERACPGLGYADNPDDCDDADATVGEGDPMGW